LHYVRPSLWKNSNFFELSGHYDCIGTIVPFDKSYVNHLANRRCFYRSLDVGFAAKYSSQINLNHSAFPACFVNSSIFQALCRLSAGSLSLQCFSFLPTKAHFSSNCTSLVFGGKRYQLIVKRLGMFGSIAAECGYFCHTGCILSDYLHRVYHNLGTFYFDNRILKELALSCLLNVKCL